MTTNMTKITNWSARRAGAGLTITGTGPGGSPVKLTRVVSIDGGAAGIVAKRDQGALGVDFFELAAS
jgi:hypothetical protein